MSSSVVTTQLGWSPSAMRTLMIPAASGTSLRGVSPVAPTLAWPNKSSSDALDFCLDATRWLADIPGDRLNTAALVAISPAGNVGDLVAAWTIVVGNLLVCWLTGGVAGQDYDLAFNATTALGRQLTQSIEIAVGMYDSSGSVIIPPAPLLTFATNLIGAGNSQLTATPLPAQVNVISSAPAGTAFVLEAGTPGVNVQVRNKDPVNAAVIYPQLMAQIDSVGLNNPVAVQPGDTANFIPTGSAQWFS